MKTLGIYIHVPFCAVKCPYCDFYSCRYSKKSACEYTKALITDINNFRGVAAADTIYFGGGTPSLIPAEFIKEILDALKKKFMLQSPEITLEINPCTVDSKKLAEYYEMGINRLSVGIQSADNDELKLLGRRHTFEQAAQIILDADKCGFKNISADLMIGLPNQTKEKIGFSVQKLSKLPVTHISSYILKIEEGTAFDNREFISSMPDDDSVSDMYLYMVKQLENQGFNQYEISNFSKMGYESRHNIKYWKCQEYAGFGPAAHSYCNGMRYYCNDDLEAYIRNGSKIIVTDENAGNNEEKIMLGLRLSEGINLNDYKNIKPQIIKKIQPLIKAGYVTLNDERLSLTPDGFLISNMIINEITECII